MNKHLITIQEQRYKLISIVNCLIVLTNYSQSLLVEVGGNPDNTTKTCTHITYILECLCQRQSYVRVNLGLLKQSDFLFKLFRFSFLLGRLGLSSTTTEKRYTIVRKSFADFYPLKEQLKVKQWVTNRFYNRNNWINKKRVYQAACVRKILIMEGF